MFFLLWKWANEDHSSSRTNAWCDSALCWVMAINISWMAKYKLVDVYTERVMLDPGLSFVIKTESNHPSAVKDMCWPCWFYQLRWPTSVMTAAVLALIADQKHPEPTWLNVQWVLINGQIHGLVSCITEVLQDQIDGGGDALLHRLAKLHPTVDHNASIPEVQDFQVFKIAQVGLQVGHKLGKRTSV